jgi:phosphoglycerate dehydrogenase-like enzyme
VASDVAWSEPVDPNDAVVKHPRSYFTPHVGGVCHGSYKTMGRIVATWSSRLSEIESSDDIQLVN